MSSLPKDENNQRHYLRLKNVVASVRGFPRLGALRVREGHHCRCFELFISECYANSMANHPDLSEVRVQSSGTSTEVGGCQLS